MGASKSKNKQVSLPWPLSSHSRSEWIEWKNCFSAWADKKSIPPYKQGDKFLEHIGLIGLEIKRNFYFSSTARERDVHILIFKFDVYFIFSGLRRHADESLDDYIRNLKMIAEKTAEKNTEKFVKEKILQELYSKSYFAEFQEIIPSFKKITNYEILSLHELIFIWKEIEKSNNNIEQNFQLDGRKRSAFEIMENRCLFCDEFHPQGSIWCSAWGKMCARCGIYNHTINCCLKNFIKECTSCGSNHVQGACPAFAKECPRCQKMNHFSWQCFSEVIACCDFCGQCHINNRQRCPAVNSTCSNCQKVGHLTFKCRMRRRNYRRY